jgi:diguanylate cyclase
MQNLDIQDNMFLYFIENMCLIIAFMFLIIKLKDYVMKKTKKDFILLWASPFLASWLALSVMYYPFIYQGIRLDLRAAPLFFTAYFVGWRVGLIATIPPIIYRIYLGGPTVTAGIIQAILLPVIIGALFHNRKEFTPPISIINIKKMLVGFLVFQILKMALMTITLPIPFYMTFTMGIFETIALLGMGLIINDSNQNLLLRKKLEYEANHDPMTQLFNIRYFKKEVQNLISQKVPIDIAMFDVDYFKHYNDTNGHQAGDEILKTIGKLLNDSVRKGDFIARYGGEEFIVCFSNISNLEEVSAAAERFRKKIEDYVFEAEETQPGGVSRFQWGSALHPQIKH